MPPVIIEAKAKALLSKLYRDYIQNSTAPKAMPIDSVYNDYLNRPYNLKSRPWFNTIDALQIAFINEKLDCTKAELWKLVQFLVDTGQADIVNEGGIPFFLMSQQTFDKMKKGGPSE